MSENTFATFSELLTWVGNQALDTIRFNGSTFSVNTVDGAQRAFASRTAGILRDIGYLDIIRLMAEEAWTACLRLPDFPAKTIEDAVLHAVAAEVQRTHTEALENHCFAWAAGEFLTTLEETAVAAEKVVSIRASRSTRKTAEVVKRILQRLEHQKDLPQTLDIGFSMAQIATIFNPVVNDPRADWSTLNTLDIDRARLFELMARLKNYSDLYGIDRDCFNKMVSDEATKRWPRAA